MAQQIGPEAAAWLTAQPHVVLVTIRADGSPQSSNVSTHFDGTVFRVSVTAGRAKTKNLARDARALVHVLGDNFWAYASVPCTAELGPITTAPGDDAGRSLLELYNSIAESPHPDEEEFLRVMVDERRQVLTLRPLSITGMGW